MDMMAMMLMMAMEYWSWRGLWRCLWTLEKTRPSTVGPQPSHPPTAGGGTSFFSGLSLLRARGRREPRTDPPHATPHRPLGAGSSIEDPQLKILN